MNPALLDLLNARRNLAARATELQREPRACATPTLPGVEDYGSALSDLETALKNLQESIPQGQPNRTLAWLSVAVLAFEGLSLYLETAAWIEAATDDEVQAIGEHIAEVSAIEVARARSLPDVSGA